MNNRLLKNVSMLNYLPELQCKLTKQLLITSRNGIVQIQMSVIGTLHNVLLTYDCYETTDQYRRPKCFLKVNLSGTYSKCTHDQQH